MFFFEPFSSVGYVWATGLWREWFGKNALTSWSSQKVFDRRFTNHCQPTQRSWSKLPIKPNHARWLKHITLHYHQKYVSQTILPKWAILTWQKSGSLQNKNPLKISSSDYKHFKKWNPLNPTRIKWVSVLPKGIPTVCLRWTLYHTVMRWSWIQGSMELLVALVHWHHRPPVSSWWPLVKNIKKLSQTHIFQGTNKGNISHLGKLEHLQKCRGRGYVSSHEDRIMKPLNNKIAIGILDALETSTSSTGRNLLETWKVEHHKRVHICLHLLLDPENIRCWC